MSNFLITAIVLIFPFFLVLCFLTWLHSGDEPEKPATESARRVNDIFNTLRFDKETHLGNGEIRLTTEKQNEILELLSK